MTKSLGDFSDDHRPMSQSHLGYVPKQEVVQPVVYTPNPQSGQKPRSIWPLVWFLVGINLISTPPGDTLRSTLRSAYDSRIIPLIHDSPEREERP